MSQPLLWIVGHFNNINPSNPWKCCMFTFVLSAVYFTGVLQFLWYRSFTSLDRFNPRCFILCYVIVNWIISYSLFAKSFFFFQFWCILFLYLFWLLWLRLSIWYWTKVMRVSILLLQSYSKRVLFYTTEYDIMCGFIIYGFIMLWYVPSILIFYRDFYHKRMFNLVKDFFCIYLNENMIFVL